MVRAGASPVSPREGFLQASKSLHVILSALSNNLETSGGGGVCVAYEWTMGDLEGNDQGKKTEEKQAEGLEWWW